MAEETKQGNLFIVDNRDEGWTALRYLEQWTEIATGYFEIGALLALDGKWQGLEKIRILLGDETSARTKTAIAKAVRKHTHAKLDASMEAEKDRNPFLTGVDARGVRRQRLQVQRARHGRLVVPGTAQVLQRATEADLCRGEAAGRRFVTGIIGVGGVFAVVFAAVSALLRSSTPVPASRWMPKNSGRVDTLEVQRVPIADASHLKWDKDREMGTLRYQFGSDCFGWFDQRSSATQSSNTRMTGMACWLGCQR
jgi:hypothetical protein